MSADDKSCLVTMSGRGLQSSASLPAGLGLFTEAATQLTGNVVDGDCAFDIVEDTSQLNNGTHYDDHGAVQFTIDTDNDCVIDDNINDIDDNVDDNDDNIITADGNMDDSEHYG